MTGNIDTRYTLKLYIFGKTGKSESAIETIEKICQTHLRDNCTLEIIDLSERPELGQQDNILVTPTLIKKKPAPECRIIGNFSKTAEVLASLNIESNPAELDRDI